VCYLQAREAGAVGSWFYFPFLPTGSERRPFPQVSSSSCEKLFGIQQLGGSSSRKFGGENSQVKVLESLGRSLHRISIS
jgi:hypothetical protein